MFFDNLGHGVKDGVILFLVIFGITLSLYVLDLNNKLKWWIENSASPNKNTTDRHGPDNFASTLAIIALVSVGIFTCYVIYNLYYHKKIVGVGKINIDSSSNYGRFR